MSMCCAFGHLISYRNKEISQKHIDEKRFLWEWIQRQIKKFMLDESELCVCVRKKYKQTKTMIRKILFFLYARQMTRKNLFSRSSIFLIFSSSLQNILRFFSVCHKTPRVTMENSVILWTSTNEWNEKYEWWSLHYDAFNTFIRSTVCKYNTYNLFSTSFSQNELWEKINKHSKNIQQTYIDVCGLSWTLLLMNVSRTARCCGDHRHTYTHALL